MAMVGHDMDGALQAARQWVLLAPNDPQAVASSLAVAASNGDTTGPAGALWTRNEKAQDNNVAIAQAASIVAKLRDKKHAYAVLYTDMRAPVDSLHATPMCLAVT